MEGKIIKYNTTRGTIQSCNL